MLYSFSLRLHDHKENPRLNLVTGGDQTCSSKIDYESSPTRPYRFRYRNGNDLGLSIVPVEVHALEYTEEEVLDELFVHSTTSSP